MYNIIPTLYFCKVTDIHISNDILTRLPNERQNRIKQALKPQKAIHLYASSLLLGYVLNKYQKILDDVKFTETGKPYIDLNLCFNVSHSGKYVAVVIDENDVGIDIQEKTIISNAAAKMFFFDGESVCNSPESEFYYSYIWCRKEAFLKCLGVGWSGEKENNHSVLKNKIVHKGIEFYLTDYTISKDYFLTVCEKNVHKIFTIEEVSKHELELFYK